MTVRNQTTEIRRQAGLNRAAAIISMIASSNENEAQNAARALCGTLASHGLTVHDIADRIRPDKVRGEHEAGAPVWTTLNVPVRKIWFDVLRLKGRPTRWEEQFLRDIRDRALSPWAKLSTAQTRTIQGLIDRAWQAGVRP